MFRACLIGCVLLATGCLWARGGPPMRTDDPGTPGPGNWEINVALTSERRADERVFEAPIADINYGLGERLQLKLEIPWVVRGTDDSPTKSGLGNSLLGVKWRFYDDQQHEFQISTYPQLELNNPTHSVERGLVERGARRSLARSMSTLRLVRFSQRGHGEFFLGTALGRQMTEKMELLGEVYSIGSAEGRDTTFGFGTRNSPSAPTGSEDQPTFIGYGGLQVVIERHRH